MEVLEREARILGAALLRNLPLERRYHSRNRDFLLAPHPQGRRRAAPKKLHFRTVLGEGVPGDKEAQHRFFPCQALVLAPGRYVGQCLRGRGGGGVLPEQRMLPGRALLLPHLGFAEGLIQRRHELGAMPAQRVARAGIDQGLDDPLVAQPQVDAVAQLDERAVRRCLTARNDRRDRPLTHIAHGTQPKADPLIPDHRELIT